MIEIQTWCVFKDNLHAFFHLTTGTISFPFIFDAKLNGVKEFSRKNKFEEEPQKERMQERSREEKLCKSLHSLNSFNQKLLSTITGFQNSFSAQSSALSHSQQLMKCAHLRKGIYLKYWRVKNE